MQLTILTLLQVGQAPLPGPTLAAIGLHGRAWSVQFLLGEGRVGAALDAVCEVWVRVDGPEALPERTVGVQEQL